MSRKKTREMLTPSRFQVEFIKALGSVSYGHRDTDVFRSFCTMGACAMGAGTREAEYLDEAKRWSKDELLRMADLMALLVEGMELAPFTDLLGPVYMEIGQGKGQAWGGEFYTPFELSRMVAQMTIGNPDEVERWPVTMLEPACGSGGMVLAAVEHIVQAGRNPRDIRATCVDTSRTACDMCLINLTLCGIPAEVIHGNSLSLEQWGGWRNIWWFWPHAGSERSNAVAAALALLTEGTPPPDRITQLQPSLFDLQESIR